MLYLNVAICESYAGFDDKCLKIRREESALAIKRCIFIWKFISIKSMKIETQIYDNHQENGTCLQMFWHEHSFVLNQSLYLMWCESVCEERLLLGTENTFSNPKCVHHCVKRMPLEIQNE